MERLSLLFAALLGSAAYAQNLVPNGSFEEYTDCPIYFGQWMEVVAWTSPYTASADYFNSCAEDTICGVPFNHFGFQWPSEGNGYMGLATFSYNDPDYREIILAELTQPLDVGVPVAMAMDVACGGWGSYGPNSAHWKARGPGLKFFVELPDDWSTYLYPNEAPLHMGTVLADTTDWTRLTGLYVPDSAYRYVAITNFFEDSLSWPSVQEGAGFFGCAYAFVDNLCVSPGPTYCGDHIGQAEHSDLRPLVFPNPVATELHFVLPSATSQMTVSMDDIAGRMIHKQQMQPSARQQTLDVSYLPEGVYVLHVTDGTHSFAPVRFVHVAE